jgi:PhnB protein
VPKAIAYLSFDGSAAEAMRFYAKVLDGKVEALVKFGDVPSSGQTPSGNAGKVMHAVLSLADGGVLMASDWIGGRPYEGMKGFSIALNYGSVDEARRVFDALADGGMVIMPLQPAFFAEAFGMTIDRFGTPWAIAGGPRNG